MKIEKKNPFYVSTPIFYANGKAHIGHTYAMLVAELLRNYRQQTGFDTFFVTGSDEHGEKMQKSALKEGMSPKEWVDLNSESFRQTWKSFDFSHDLFYRTTQKDHYELVSKVLERLFAQEDIYFAEYEGRYCVGCERFLTEAELNEDSLCIDHLTEPQVRKEANYFFKMQKYQEELLAFLAKNPNSVEPKRYMTELLSLLKEPVGDLCISRPKTRCEWGIELPFDQKYVTYVWFDALLNYLGALGYLGGDPQEPNSWKADNRQDFWPNVHHVIGKDILKTHGIYWPTMLLAMGFSPFKKLFVSGFWTVSGQKMSKSLGNVLDPMEVAKEYGFEYLKYYMLREMSFGEDASFQEESFFNRCNADLAGGIANLCARTLNLVKKNFEDGIDLDIDETEAEKSLLTELASTPVEMSKYLDKCQFHKALAEFSKGVAACDRYINEKKPWSLAKDPKQREELQIVLATAIKCLWTLGVVMAPFFPDKSKTLLRVLGQPDGAQLPAWQDFRAYPKMKVKIEELPRLFERILPPEA